MKYMFAYGSNMSSPRLNDYGVNPPLGEAAMLPNHTLVFNKRSSDCSGKANVMPSPGGTVWGVLYSLAASDVSLLSHREKGYQPTEAVVITRDGTSQAALLYLAGSASQVAGLLPYSWYKEFIVAGAKEHGLPPEYVAYLETLVATEDTNQERNARMRALLT
jgi:cation transport regulator ChaC